MKLRFILISTILLTLICCDQITVLLMNGDKKTINAEFECGKVELSITTMGGYIFTLFQKYELNNKIVFNKNNLTHCCPV